MIQVQDFQGRWIEITDHKLMVDALVQEYYSKYHQTEATPPMTFPLRHYLGYLGTVPHANTVLNGQTPPLPGLSPYADRLLKNLRRITHTNLFQLVFLQKIIKTAGKKLKKLHPLEGS